MGDFWAGSGSDQGLNGVFLNSKSFSASNLKRFLGAMLNGLGDRHSDLGLRLEVEESRGDGEGSSPSEVCSNLGILGLDKIRTGSLDFRLFRFEGLSDSNIASVGILDSGKDKIIC